MCIRQFFAGSNSGEGFYSFFDQIIGPEAKRIYLLKGGPGTGKSYFMKEIARTFQEENVEQELFYCSSDPGSLDAIHFPKLGIALMDATAPHAQEPEWPGCRDEIVNLGFFWSGQKLAEKRTEIMGNGLMKRSHFARAFHYFAAAKALDDIIEDRNTGQELPWPVEVRALKPELAQKPGRVRHLFLSALTPEGYVSHLESFVNQVPQRLILMGPRGSGQATYLKEIADYVQQVGFDLEVFHCPLNPKKYLHLFIPNLELAILTALPEEPLAELNGTRLHWEEQKENQAQNNADQALLEVLIQRGILELSEARAGHGSIEHYYTEAMDFLAITTYREKILEEIRTYKNLS